MRNIGKLWLVTLVTLVPMLSYAKQENYPATKETLENEVASLPWEAESTSYQLSKSNSSLQLPNGMVLLRGSGAERYMYLTQGVEYPDVEAAIVNVNNYAQVIFSYHDSGYVSIDDWDEINPSDLLKEVKNNTVIANKERSKLGLPELHVMDWLTMPVLDKKSDAAYWAISLMEDGENMVNAITLKLGKNGFEKVVWVGNAEQYLNSDGMLEAMLNAHKFNQGFRYADYSIGDNVAAFGIATLVAASAGGKSKAGKTTLAAIGIAILAFMKKFIIVPIILVFGGFWALIKRPFSRKAKNNRST